MGHSILLSSPSSLLAILLRDDSTCAISLSLDRKSLSIEETFGKSITGVGMKLKRISDNEMIIHSLLIPIRYSSSLVSIRLDPFLPLFFDNETSGDSNLHYSDDKALFHCDQYKHLAKYSLIVVPIIERRVTVPRPAKVNTESVKIGPSSLAVSKELLALYSDFFSNLFYGPLSEKNEEKEIKEVSETDFVCFLQSLHARKFEMNSVRIILSNLEFADRYLMPTIFKKVLPYLKDQKLPISLLDHSLIVADRMNNNKEILEWILSQSPYNSQLLQVLHSILPSISPTTAQLCLQLGVERIGELEKKVEGLQLEQKKDKKEEIVEKEGEKGENAKREEEKKEEDEKKEEQEEKKEANVVYRKMEESEKAAYGRIKGTVSVHVRFVDSWKTVVESEDYFHAEYCTAYSNRLSVSESFWSKIPEKYKAVKILNSVYTRDTPIFFDSAKRLEVVAYPTWNVR